MTLEEIKIEQVTVTGDHILVRQKKKENSDSYEKTKSGIFVASDNSENGPQSDPSNISEVIGIGDGCSLKVEEGQFVMHQPFAGFRFSKGNYDYMVIRDTDVFFIA